MVSRPVTTLWPATVRVPRDTVLTNRLRAVLAADPSLLPNGGRETMPARSIDNPVSVLRVVIAEPMAGVRSALAALLRAEGLQVDAQVPTVAQALAAPGEVLVAALRFADGDAADLCAHPRPVVVVTPLPADEHDGVDLCRAAAVLRHGHLAARLAAAVRAAAERS